MTLLRTTIFILCLTLASPTLSAARLDIHQAKQSIIAHEKQTFTSDYNHQTTVSHCQRYSATKIRCTVTDPSFQVFVGGDAMRCHWRDQARLTPDGIVVKQTSATSCR